jgi:hypothetical protein
MPDFDRADQILWIGQTISRLPTGNKDRPYMNTPPPIIGMWATELYEDFGVRVHPDLAKKELVRVASPAGNHGPIKAVSKNTPAPLDGGPDVQKTMQHARTLLLEWLADKDPELHRRIVAAEGDPMASALLLAEIQRDHPEVMAKGEEMLANVSAKTFEPRDPAE